MKRDVLTFLLFLLVATALWYGHAMQSVRNTRVPVRIQYTGMPGAIGLRSPGLPDTVMVEVRDAGARLNAYYQEPLRLTIDLRSYIHGEKGTIRVPSDALRRSISDILQGTSRLIETTPDEIACDYFTEQEKTVALLFEGEANPASEYQMVNSPVLARKRMKIYGEDKALNAIDTVYTEPVVLSDLMDTTDVRLALHKPNDVRLEFDSVDMRVVTERFTEKKIIVPIRVVGLPEGSHIRLFPKEVEVNARVGISHFQQVKPTDIKATCTYTPESTDKLDVEIQYTNPYITSAWSYPGTVEYILEQ